MSLIIPILLCYLSVDSGANAFNSSLLKSKIVGGNPAALADFPYMVFFIENNIYIGCGGCLVSKTNILTSAHCIVDFAKTGNYDTLRVVVGTVSLQYGGNEHTIKHISISDQYLFDERTIRGDIAVVTLHRSIKLSAFVSFIPFSEYDIIPGTEAVISGWGLINKLVRNNITIVFEDHLRTLNVTTIYNYQCEKFFKRPLIQMYNICTLSKNESEDVATGDNGSPLVQGGTVVAIVSRCIDKNIGYPTIYTRVSYYSKFIKNAMLEAAEIPSKKEGGIFKRILNCVGPKI